MLSSSMPSSSSSSFEHGDCLQRTGLKRNFCDGKAATAASAAHLAVRACVAASAAAPVWSLSMKQMMDRKVWRGH
eukprot:CAMPEP_0178385960 /NCGR_PEP_ID=MMETSP0689_2-20121128/8301_1 /TAXON_ID=160604 /ORGANISM="Amphidinium massartii, Strain CS-259" /LENGTH=74 /DNA_ID=CAMNT_0020006257 /DNA_START=99 /DNA_END=327 /DNA_ORIENTATION=-